MNNIQNSNSDVSAENGTKPLVVCLYKITAKKNGLGWRCVLWKKFLWFWIPETIIQTRFGYEHMGDETINEWIRQFDIPLSNVAVSK